MSRSKDKASAVNHGDHEVIVPENKLRGAVSKGSRGDDGNDGDDPIARAEKALAALSPEFGAWMDSECERLDGARREIVDSGFTDTNKEALFRAAHDIKGEAATFGYPAVASAAESLCRLIEHAPDPSRIPGALIDQHVDAVRAIYREYGHSDAQKLATALTKRLREVADDFLIRENRDRPDVLRQLNSPSIVPR
ncbi:MAG TPA: Hpt domain-containing protein [Pseudolabrys sp.]|jgi:HPt (histidine-containing phosphotransfer) domain-containing protein